MVDETLAKEKSESNENVVTINGVDFVIEDNISSKNEILGHFRGPSENEILKVENGASPTKPSDIETAPEINYRPIIGILAQELSSSLEPWYPDKTSYIGAAYVKYIEQAGARVVPVLINQTEEYYDTIFRSTNGLLIPGGAVSIVDSGL